MLVANVHQHLSTKKISTSKAPFLAQHLYPGFVALSSVICVFPASMFSFVSETSEDRDVARQHARLDDLEHERREGRGIGSDRGGLLSNAMQEEVLN